MTYDAQQFVANAKADKYNDPGMCLQQTRIWAGIPSYYPDATTAWQHATHRHGGDTHPPAGAVVYWTGGSHGYGHVACSLGGGKIRSTDAGGSGYVATVDLGWVHQHWGLPYAGWADNINGYTIPGVGDEGGDMSNAVWDEQLTLWIPTSADKQGDEMRAGQQMNQARGYANAAYDNTQKIKQALRVLAKDPALSNTTQTNMLDKLEG